jgi:hypothetical protein
VGSATKLFRIKIEKRQFRVTTTCIYLAYLRTRGSQPTNRLLAVCAKWKAKKIKWTKKT